MARKDEGKFERFTGKVESFQIRFVFKSKIS